MNVGRGSPSEKKKTIKLDFKKYKVDVHLWFWQYEFKKLPGFHSFPCSNGILILGLHVSLFLEKQSFLI